MAVYMNSRSHRQRTRPAAAVTAIATAAAVVLVPGVVWAADTIPNPAADGSAPGAVLVGTVLGWLKWAGLASALAGLLIGAITTGVGHFGSNYGASAAGRKWLMGGMGSAILSGLAWTIATTLFAATGG
jgi:hypothetical protein